MNLKVRVRHCPDAPDTQASVVSWLRQQARILSQQLKDPDLHLEVSCSGIPQRSRVLLFGSAHGTPLKAAGYGDDIYDAAQQAFEGFRRTYERKQHQKQSKRRREMTPSASGPSAMHA